MKANRMEYLDFTKMEAIGNNFVLIDASDLPPMNWSLLAVRMGKRHFGVGSDGLLVILRSNTADLRMRMFNPDGSEDSCGNGLRCAAIYAYKNGICTKSNMSIEARNGIRKAEIIESRGVVAVRVNMGKPSFNPADLPSPVLVDKMIDFPLELEDQTFLVTCVVVGSPHAFIRAPLESFWNEIPAVSEKIENHILFPERISVNWYAPISNTEIKIRTWERAVGPTLGCGTGASSAIAAANVHGFEREEADITSPGGTLHIEWKNKQDVYMMGPANTVFTGKWILEGDEEE